MWNGTSSGCSALSVKCHFLLINQVAGPVSTMYDTVWGGRSCPGYLEACVHLHVSQPHLAWSTRLLSLDWLSRRHVGVRTDLSSYNDGGLDAHLVSGLETCNIMIKITICDFLLFSFGCHVGFVFKAGSSALTPTFSGRDSVAMFFAGMSSLTSNGRMLWAFSRDNALPFSPFWCAPAPASPMTASGFFWGFVGGFCACSGVWQSVSPPCLRPYLEP